MHCCLSCSVMLVAPCTASQFCKSCGRRGAKDCRDSKTHSMPGEHGVWGPASSLLQIAACPLHISVLYGCTLNLQTHLACTLLPRFCMQTACTSCTSTHACNARSCFSGALCVHSSCLMHVLSHLARTLHAHSCPTHRLIPCTPLPTALPVLCLCIPPPAWHPGMKQNK